jgi:hypothetical protein
MFKGCFDLLELMLVASDRCCDKLPSEVSEDPHPALCNPVP